VISNAVVPLMSGKEMHFKVPPIGQNLTDHTTNQAASYKLSKSYPSLVSVAMTTMVLQFS